MKDYNTALRQHYDSVWNCTDRLVSFEARGRIEEVNPYFEVLEIMPGSARPMWTYATVGMAGENGDAGLELHAFSARQNPIWREILESIAHFHLTETRLALDHTVNFGVGVIPDSNLTHGLISLPYLDGRGLELFRYGTREISCLWLIPITRSELQYLQRYGLEALESVFEENTFDYADPARASLL